MGFSKCFSQIPVSPKIHWGPQGNDKAGAQRRGFLIPALIRAIQFLSVLRISVSCRTASSPFGAFV